jgi:hypothetical protein
MLEWRQSQQRHGICLIAGKLAVEASGNLNSYSSPEDKWLAAGNKRLRLP